MQDLLERRIGEIARGVAAAHGAAAALDYRRRYPPTVNHAAEAAFGFWRGGSSWPSTLPVGLDLGVAQQREHASESQPPNR